MKLKISTIKNYLPDALDFLAPLLGLLAFIAFLYGMYWVFKTGSYWFFYEDMVQDTIREMVKAGSLK